ncbi:hypothetical protein AMATHDRAFT_147990, partial [Amanita thiersii Skay4041]
WSDWVVFSFILFCLCCVRLHYTTTLDSRDPLNGGVSFYDPIIVELLVTTILTILWSLYIIYCIYKRVETKYVSKYYEELIGLALLWLFWIIGAADASAIWGTLSFCQKYEPCRVLSALMAFAWLGWLTLTGIVVLVMLYVMVNKFWNEPFHGRFDPRLSLQMRAV